MSVRGDILINLQTALAEIKTANGYNTDIGSDDKGPIVYLRPFTAKEVNDKNLATPALSIVDGPDTYRGTIDNYDFDLITINLDAIIRESCITDKNISLTEYYNLFISDIRKCVKAVDLGIYFNYIRLGDIAPIIDEDVIYITIPCKILYHHSESEATITESATIYGSNTIIDQSRAAIKALLDELLAAMAAAETNPRPLSVYDSHEQVKMTMPALTIGFDGEGSAEEGSGIDLLKTIGNWSIRIHMDYEDGYLNEKALGQVINSIRNYLFANGHEDFGAAIDGFAGISFDSYSATIGDSFKETLTIGGTIKFQIKTFNEY